MRFKSFFILLLIGFIAQQCAKQTAPTGGPKDETSPKMMSSNPEHKQVNFKGKEIELTFDEAVQLNNPREQILITPTVGQKFEATAKKNKVTIKLNAELSDSTTYNINFRESVQDITEKNQAVIKLAFSTGSHIDSLHITGTIKDILTDKELNNYTVALTPAIDTFDIFKHSAPWITLTNKKGRFAIENLKQGNYFIYAFDDKNKNLVVDSKSEKYGFKSENINLTEKMDSIKINVFRLDATKFKIMTARPTFAYYNVRLSKSIAAYKLYSPNSTEKFHSTLESDKSTIKIYNSIPNLDSLQVRLEAIDSSESKVDTLIYIKFQKKESTKDKFTAKVESAYLYETGSTISASVIFSKPVTRIFTDSIFLQLDSLNKITFTKDDISWNPDLTKLFISKKIEIPKQEASKTKSEPKSKQTAPESSQESELSNQLYFKKGFGFSIENDSTPELTATLKLIKPQDYGIISAKVVSNENHILQLLDKSGNLIEEVKNIKLKEFENIPAATYMLRVFLDLDKNGKWDTGNFLTRKQPEPVLFYNNPKGGKDIILKANWLVGPLLITE
jgi:uncharacterized protein (DUF2141 family)